jgi:hypothetical protein
MSVDPDRQGNPLFDLARECADRVVESNPAGAGLIYALLANAVANSTGANAVAQIAEAVISDAIGRQSQHAAEATMLIPRAEGSDSAEFLSQRHQPNTAGYASI